MIDADRRFLALADDPHDPAAGNTLLAAKGGAGRAETLRRLGRAPPPLRLQARLTAAAAALGRLPRNARLAGNALLQPRRNGDNLEIVARHRVLVLLAQEALLDEDVDAGRKIAGTGLALVEVDRSRVLLAPEDELGFTLALHFMPPHRHRDRHKKHHDADAHEQSRHGIAALGVLTL